MSEEWNHSIRSFILEANNAGVRMIMVEGGAVNFHGYQRHSADVDFWLEATPENFSKMITVFKALGYDLEDFPEQVKKKRQNISVKFSPIDLNLELITQFSTQKSFEDAYNDSIETTRDELSWRVLCYEDLVESKLKAQRPKDLLDIQELKRIRSGN